MDGCKVPVCLPWSRHDQNIPYTAMLSTNVERPVVEHGALLLVYAERH